jgi:type IV pilus assembly protein PilA
MLLNRLIQQFFGKNSRIYSCHTREIGVTFTQKECSRKHPRKPKISASAFCLGITIINFLPIFSSSTAAEVQLSQAIKAKEAEGKQYVSSMNKAQQAYYAENTGFTSSVANLGLGIKTETVNYKYSISTADKAVFNYGVSRNANLKSFVGGVFLIGTTTKTILCQTNAASKTKPTNPSNKNGVLVCGANTAKISG